MAVIKCKMCGGDLVIEPGTTVAECEYCGTKQTVPTADNEKKMTLFSRANRLRLACEFDKAAGIYEAIVAEFPEEAEAYWGLVLCKFGIEYVDDPAAGKKIPTCHRSSFQSILDDADLEQALENADALARKIYREEARQIEEIRKGIIEVSSREDPYDIFICYKETDANGDRTLDSVLAQDIYDALTEKGYRVFFSRISLEDKLGQEYEPYIFAALNSAKIMLAVGTDYEHYNAVWVKNEWSRFLHMISSGQKKYLIPCYKNIDAYDMPKEFLRLQAQDLGKIGAMQDLLRGIGKLLPLQDAAGAVRTSAQGRSSAADVRQNDPENVSALIAKGLKIQAIKLLREKYGLGLRDATNIANQIQRGETVDWESLQKQTGGASQESKDTRDVAGTPKGSQDSTDPLFSALTPAPQGMNEIAACIRQKKTDKALELIQEYYELPDSQAQVFCQRAEQCLMNAKYPFPADAAAGAAADKVKAELSNCFQDLRSQIRSLNEQESESVKAYNEYHERRPDYCANRLDYYNGRIRYYVGRVLYYADRLEKAEAALRKLETSETRPLNVVNAAKRFAPPKQQLYAIALQRKFRSFGHGFEALRQDGTILRYETNAQGVNKLAEYSNPSGAVAFDPINGQPLGLNSSSRIAWSGNDQKSGKTQHIILKWDGKLFVRNALNLDFAEFGPSWDRITDLAFIGSKMCVALREDGTVYCAALTESESPFISERIRILKTWRNITAIAASDVECFGLRSDGTVVTTNPRGYADVEKWRDIVSLSCNQYYQIAGVKADGTVVSKGFFDWTPFDVSGWKNVAAVICYNGFTVGITKSGKVLRTMTFYYDMSSYQRSIQRQAGYRLYYEIPGLQLFQDWEAAAQKAVSEMEQLQQHWAQRQDIDKVLEYQLEELSKIQALEKQLGLTRAQLNETKGLFSGGKRKALEEQIAQLEAQIRARQKTVQ